MQAQALSILQILKILHLFLVSGGNLWLLYHCQLNPQFYAYIVLYIPVLACSNQLQAAKTRAELVMLVDQLYQLVKSVCVLVLLYIPLSMMHIPGPCRHSITNDHLLQINHLINNHLRNGCSISYVFIEKRHLSSVCYVKAALPRVLDLLSVHFRYSRGSESALLVRSLQNLIHNIYSQRCVPPLNEQLEEDPVVFLKQFTDSPIQALQRAKEVLDIYLQLITQTHTNTSVDWSCAMEYSNYTTVVITELPRTHRTEATQAMLGQIEQDSSDLSFYKLGFTVLAVSGGIFLLITVSCLIHRKRFHQLRRQDMELDTWSDVSHIGFCSTAFNRMDLII